ncbi:nuclear transport factor 2 family protein [Sulfitobacter sp. JB4-11]|uniref:nuclear transport factor 2 family protein n=1 Tax=Sulfitobacter rhodophyticola TaxID=3238304 RepID=UPI003D81599B
MPIVELHILEGYTSNDKQRLGTVLTDAVRLVVPAPPEAITIMIHEMPTDRYYRGGEQRMGAPALEDPAKVVRAFLDAMQARQLDQARALLADGFVMQFPGSPALTRLEDMVDWAKPRYRFVTKTFDGFDTMQGAGQAAVVYCRGTLSGEWPDGTAFDGIRFIDRFEVAGGKITKQDVWNDIAETRAQT